MADQPRNTGDPNESAFGGGFTQPTQPAQPQPVRFIPDGYQSPQTIQRKLDKRQADVRRLNDKLAKAKLEDASQNPYAINVGTPQAPKWEPNRIAYDEDSRELNVALMEVNQLMMQMNQAEQVGNRLSSSLEGAVQRVWQENSARIPENVRKAVEARYRELSNQLLQGGHFLTGVYQTTEQVSAALGQALYSAIGQTVAAPPATPGGLPSGQSAGGQDEPQPTPSADPNTATFANDPRAMAIYNRLTSPQNAPKTLADNKNVPRHGPVSAAFNPQERD